MLARLSRWLELNQGLSSSYRMFKYTGLDHFGDPSPSIYSGKIVASAEARHRNYVSTPIPEAVLQRGNEVYAACRETLLGNQGEL